MSAAKPRLRISLPVSDVGMEYGFHKKSAAMISYITELISAAKQKCSDIEFCAEDATRADIKTLVGAINAAIQAGALSITFCDNEGVMLPDEFSTFIEETVSKLDIPNNITLGVSCSNANGLAAACSVMALKGAASLVKTAVNSNITPLSTIIDILKNCGNNCSLSAGIRFTSTKRTLAQIEWILNDNNSGKIVSASDTITNDQITLDNKDDISTVAAAVKSLGYDLSEEDINKVFEEVKRVGEKKKITAKELEAIVASVALQVPPTYKLISYIINSGNIVSSSAQIILSKNEQEIQGIAVGDGPIDAAFQTIEQIIGHHYELDDFQIQSVTEGREAMGSAIVKLRSNGKLYSGKGISTDIMGASIRAYINALNKIVYEEA